MPFWHCSVASPWTVTCDFFSFVCTVGLLAHALQKGFVFRRASYKCQSAVEPRWSGAVRSGASTCFPGFLQEDNNRSSRNSPSLPAGRQWWSSAAFWSAKLGLPPGSRDGLWHLRRKAGAQDPLPSPCLSLTATPDERSTTQNYAEF